MLKRIGAEESGELKAIASGTLPCGKPVVVNADGTVSVVAQAGPSVSSLNPVVFETGAMNQGESRPSAVYDTANGKIVLAYRDENNSNYGTAFVGTVSNGSVSFGSAVIFQSASVNYIDTAYDSNAGKVVIVYSDGQSDGNAIVGTVSGTSISFGSPAEFNGTGVSKQSVTFDSTANKVVIAYKGDSQHGHVRVGTVSGTSISFGSDNEWQTAQTNEPTVVYDSSANRSVITYVDASNSDKGAARVGTVSGTSISLGSEVIFHTGTCSSISSCFDSTNNKIVTVFANNGDGRKGTAQVGTVSGTSISYGTAVVFNAASTDDISVDFDSTNGKVIISFADDGDSGKGKVVVGTVSGTSISFTDPIEFESGDTKNHAVAFDPDTNQAIIFYADISDSEKGKYVTFNAVVNNLTSENYIGMSRGTAFQQPVTQAVGTSVAYKQVSNAFGPVIFDSNSNKVVIAYVDGGDSGKGKCVVGTISGTSISFGSEVTFETTSNTTQIYGTFDSTNNKVILVYRQNYSTGNAIVGTVSGNSISFGSTAAFSSNNPIYFGVAFDSTNNKIVISYRAISNSNYGTAVVGTVSGTSISFGSEVVFKSARSDYTNCVHDSTNNKIVVTWTDQPNSNSQTAIVGTVSGTSISFGSAVVYFTAASYPKLVFNPDTGTAVAVFMNSSNQQGSSKIGTVSGTSISFSAESLWKSTTGTATEGLSLTYDSNAKKIVIGYRDGNNGNDGYLVTGTVGSSSITYDTPVEFADYDVSDTNAGFDSVSNKVIISYADARNTDNYGTAVVFRNASTDTIRAEVASGQPARLDIIGSVSDNQIGLTAGQQYFVQNDGTISTTAASPSVLAGTAISATELVVKT